MNCTLSKHPDGYSFSYNDGINSIFTGLSGAPYAQRHWSLATNIDQDNRCIHKSIAILEFIPIIGGLAALIERIVVFVYEKFHEIFKSKLSSIQNLKAPNCSTWLPRTLPTEIAFAKMWTNSKKSIAEHTADYMKNPYATENRDPSPVLFVKNLYGKLLKQAGQPSDVLTDIEKNNVYATVEEALPSITSLTEALSKSRTDSPVVLKYCSASERGKRSSMEDAHFFAEIDQGYITAVFDGHGGCEVARFANEQFQKRFSEELSKANGNVHQTFEALIHDIHLNISNQEAWNYAGCTAVFCFIEKSTNLIYTATLGDSEANIYREIGDYLKSIPLSVIRNWSSKKDALRAAIALKNPKVAQEWPLSTKPKDLRYPRPHIGINVSRALGDVEYCYCIDSSNPVIHKPKITINQLQQGDILLLVCDGVKDFVSEHEIVRQIEDYKLTSGDNLAKQIVTYSLKEKKSTDNITVVAVEF